LGQGGFGVALKATDWEGETVCLKVTPDQEAWHQEAYFGSLLKGSRRVIQLIESFPLHAEIGNLRYPCYVLVFEYAPNGDIATYLERKGPWPEERARREIIALLKVLTQLHSGGSMHRDITPRNVLVGQNGNLKLHDFGIARQQLLGKRVPADIFCPAFVSNVKQDCGRRHWLMADDVFQMGQLLAMILRGDGTELVSSRDIGKLDCSDELKVIIRKATGTRSERYETAYDMLLAMEGHDIQKPPVRTLRNKRVVFTGPLSIRRDDAALLVAQAGGTVQDSVHGNTNVVVVGQRSKLYKQKLKGRKLKEVEALNRAGARIRLINEPQFMRLVQL
jgi:serine/threonine protein kinase